MEAKLVKLLNIICILTFVIIIIFMTKPIIMFKPNGQQRVYGFGTDTDGYKKTLYVPHFIILIVIILLYKLTF